MSDKIDLKVTKRTISGRAVKALRRQNIVPGNVFGKGVDSVMIQLDADDFKKVFAKTGETSVINLTVDGESKSRPVLISTIHIHPVTDAFLHVDFHQVDLTQKVTATVPVELEGIAPAIEAGAVIVQLVNEVDVESLPSDLPEKIVVNLEVLKEAGDVITVKDIPFDSTKVKILLEDEAVIVQAQEPQKEEVQEVAPVTTEAETPAAAAPEAK